MNGQILGRNTDLNCYWSLEVWNSGEFLEFKWLYLYSAAQNMEEEAAAAAAASLQSCPTLCDPRDASPPGSPIPGILQARTLAWVMKEARAPDWQPLIDKHQTPQPSYWLPSCPEPHPSTFCNMIWVGRGLKAVNEEGLVQGGCQFM